MFDLIVIYKTVVTTLNYWRRARDSNPQVRKDAGFQDRCISRSASPPKLMITGSYITVIFSRNTIGGDIGGSFTEIT